MRFGLREGDGEARANLLGRIRRRPADDLFLTTAEAALLLLVTPATVRRWADKGRVATVRSLGGHRRFRASEVLALLEQLEGETTWP